MRRAQSAAEAEAAQTSDNPKMIRFLRIQTTPSVTFSYRQVEYIGQRVYEKVQEGLEHPLDPEEVKKFIPEIKEDEAKTVMLSGAIEEAKAFLYLNKAFVQAGGRDNPELRARIEEVVNQWWMTDTDIISGQPKPWDPDYFLKP